MVTWQRAPRTLISETHVGPRNFAAKLLGFGNRRLSLYGLGFN